MPYKVAVIGAARRHQGTGPFVAARFAAAGHDICGIVGTSQDSLRQTLAQLFKQSGIISKGYLKFEVLIERHQPDIVAICSPASTHAGYLQTALANNLHVFCEKPLYWPEHELQPANSAGYEKGLRDLLALARQKQRYIHVNQQWPYTLKFFNRIHPDVLNSNQIDQFSMYLSPQSADKKMLIDAAPHGLSMLYQLVGAGTLENIRARQTSQQHMQIDFDYRHKQGRTQVRLGFAASQAVPKPARYAINGCYVDRHVGLPAYQIRLQSGRHDVPIDDPLDLSVKDFLACLQARLACDETMLLLGARHLYQLIENS